MQQDMPVFYGMPAHIRLLRSRMSFLPSRFIFFPTTGYMVVTATAAAVIPTAMPAAKPHSFISKIPPFRFPSRIAFVFFARGIRGKIWIF